MASSLPYLLRNVVRRSDGDLETERKLYVPGIDLAAEKAENAADGTAPTDLATKGQLDAAISGLVDAAPGALDTLNELAAALGDDANFASTVTTALAAKASTAQFASLVGTRRKMLRATGRLTTAAGSGSIYLFSGTNADTTGTNASGTNSAQTPGIWLDPADLAVSGYTPKLRVIGKARTATNPNVTATIGLYPITGAANITPGTVVSGSAAAVVATSANALPRTAGSDFDVPTAGEYMLCLVLSGTPASALVVEAELELRYV